MPRARKKGPAFWRIAIGGMTASVFALFSLAAFTAPPATEPDGWCRLDRRDPAHTVLMIDQSDPFVERDYDWVAALLDEESRLLPKYGRLTVVTPDSARPYQPRVVFSACTPGSADRANPIFENPRMIEHRWRSDFKDQLTERVDALLKDDQASNSPLGETVFAVFDRPDFQDTVRRRRLVIVSDLMQNSEEFSFYTSGADRLAFGQTRLASEKPDMTGADVVARIVPRQEYDLPISSLRVFWEDYFGRAGARFESVT
ncbi:MAG: hypothetical protein AAFQ67_05730 [Pseudomonadota bacterium]